MSPIRPSARCRPPQDHVDQAARSSGAAGNADAPILVHCWAGISRSTAAAYHPAVRPLRRGLRRGPCAQIAALSRAACLSQCADGANWPTRRLNRGGRMVARRRSDRPRHASSPRANALSFRCRWRNYEPHRQCGAHRPQRRDRFGRGGNPARAGRRSSRYRRRAAVRPLRSLEAPHARKRLAQLGARTDLSRSRLCRTALHLRRSRPAYGQIGRRPARRLGRLSGAGARRSAN